MVHLNDGAAEVGYGAARTGLSRFLSFSPDAW